MTTTASVVHRPIRRLHVVENLGLAGLESSAIKQVNHLDRHLFCPMIFCLRFQFQETRSLIDDTIKVFELGKKPGRELRVVLRLASLLRNQRIEIVHSHNWRTFVYTVIS